MRLRGLGLRLALGLRFRLWRLRLQVSFGPFFSLRAYALGAVPKQKKLLNALDVFLTHALSSSRLAISVAGLQLADILQSDILPFRDDRHNPLAHLCDFHDNRDRYCAAWDSYHDFDW